MSTLSAEQQPLPQQQQQPLFVEEGKQGLQAYFDDLKPKAGAEADASIGSAHPLVCIGHLDLPGAEDDSAVGVVRDAQWQRPGTPTRRGLVANDLLGGLTDLPLRRSLFGDGIKAAEKDASPVEFSNFSVLRASSGIQGSCSGCEERSTNVDRYSGTGLLSEFCDSTPSVIDGYAEQVDSSTEVASEPGTTRQGEAVSTCGPTPKPDRPEAAEPIPSALGFLAPENVEASTASDLGSIMKFGLIGAEALETLERVQDAECWYKLNKQLNHMGNSDAKDIKEWQTMGSSASKLLDAAGMSDYDKANDDDVWASLRRQISSLDKEVAGIAERHAGPEEDEEAEGARRMQEQIMANDLQGKIARLEVDVQEMVGAGCNVKERNLSLHEQIQSLEGHVGNVVSITQNYRGEQIPFEPKQVAPGDASKQVLAMLQQITDRARQPLLAPRVEEAEQQEFIEPSRAAKTLQEQAAIAHALAANKPGSGVHSLFSRRPSTCSLGQQWQAGPLMSSHQQVVLVPATPRGGSVAGSAASLGPSAIHSNGSSVRVSSPLRPAPVQSLGSITARGVTPLRHQVLRQGSTAGEQPGAARGVSPLRQHQQLHQSAPSPAWAMTPSGPGSLTASVQGVSPVLAAAPLGPHGTLHMSAAASAAATAAATAAAAAAMAAAAQQQQQQQQQQQGAVAAMAAAAQQQQQQQHQQQQQQGSPSHPAVHNPAFGSHAARPAALGFPAAVGAMHGAGLPMMPTTKLNL